MTGTHINMRYDGASGVAVDGATATVGLATNQLRQATFFRGELLHPLVLREALATLHGVVVSDFRPVSRDTNAYQLWRAQQDRLFLQQLVQRSASAQQELAAVEARLFELETRELQARTPFVKARQRYASWVYTHQYELSMLYDPVVTVHPDEIFFEAFSKDESSYARVGAKASLFSGIDAQTCGTTNIDFSIGLLRHLERMRTHRRTHFDIAPAGVSVAVDGDVHVEKKIALPDSWVRGFHQVQSTMTRSLVRFDIAPMELNNILRVLFARKARVSPRALRFELVRGQPIRVVVEPWEITIPLRSRYLGDADHVIRTWGRDRLKLLARALPAAHNVTVHLAGFGLPTFYTLDMGDLSLTLGLSGWTDNDWASGTDMSALARLSDGTPGELLNVYGALKRQRLAGAEELAASLAMPPEKVRGLLSTLCACGRAMFDLRLGAYRHRDVFFDAFTLRDADEALNAALEATHPEAKAARHIFDTDNARVIARRPVPGGFKLSGSVLGATGERVRPQLHIDDVGAIVSAGCTCAHAQRQQAQHKDYAPCSHILALRLVHLRQREQETAGRA